MASHHCLGIQPREDRKAGQGPRANCGATAQRVAGVAIKPKERQNA